MVGIIVTFVVGAVLGVILNYGFLYVYPIWSGTAYLEIRSQLEDAQDLNSKEFLEKAKKQKPTDEQLEEIKALELKLN